MSDEWEVVPFAEVAQRRTTAWTPGQSTEVYVGLEHVAPYELRLTGTGSSDDVASNKTRFLAGDVLFGKLRPYFQKVVRPAFSGVCSTDMWAIFPLDEARVDPAFLHWVIANPAFSDFANSAETGTRMPRATWGWVSSYEVPLPPLDEQRRIAEVLGAFDDRIEACTRIASICDDLLHARWALDFDALQEQPGGTLRDLCTSQYGVTASGDTEPVGPRLLRVTDINKSNWVDWRTVPYCSVSQDELAKYSLNAGDVVVARMADPGKSAIIEVPESAVFASYLIRVTPKQPNANYFLFGFLKSRFFVEYAEGASSGSVQQNMNAQTILNAPCSVPSIEGLRDFDAWAREVRQGVIAAIKERNALLDLRDFMLPRLVSGELRVAAAEELMEAAT